MNKLSAFILAFSTISFALSTAAAPTSAIDTTLILHILDGKTDEWPRERFSTDKATKVSYATDNDKDYLFLALIISDVSFQRECMTQGMNLFIDPKGKKKESKGVEFPIALEDGAQAAKNLDFMKLFGFTKLSAFAQNIKTEGTVNIAFTWDSASTMYIEYRIPLTLFEESSSLLSNNVFGIGWKIKNNGETSTQVTRTVTTLQGRPSAGGQPITTRPVVSTTPESRPQTTSKPKYFWTSHTIIF